MRVYSYIFALFMCLSAPLWGQVEAYYAIETLPIPSAAFLEVGGMDFDANGKLYVCTRRGEVWIIDQPYAQTVEAAGYHLFAEGLHEPLGLGIKDGQVYVTQRGELTRITDQNGDGKADKYEAITTWPLSGNYHDYSYGPRFLDNGNMLLTLNLSWIGRGASLVKWRGWMMQVTPEGELLPMATGMRSPAGFALNKEGDIFYSDNQGDWVGSGRVTHIEEGDFAGNPEGLKWAAGTPVKLTEAMIAESDTLGSLYEASNKIPGVKAPAVWFPHGQMGISTSDIYQDNSGGKFGPFEGQYFVGDQGQSRVMRMYLEKVEGVYQGACFPFREGFSSGVLRLVPGQEGSVFVGMTNRGWSSTGKEPYGIQRLRWTGKTPFEIKTINIAPDGFDLTFTEKVNPRTATNPASYQLQNFTYLYHYKYGSPIQDIQDCVIESATLSKDGLSVHLTVKGLKLGYVHELKAAGVRNLAGRPLLHDIGYYTLNRIPGGQVAAALMGAGSETSKGAGSLAKNQTEMPATWTQGPEQVVEVATEPGMRYDLKQFTIKAGSKVRLNFNNDDDMQHNLVIVTQGSAESVAQAALDMGIKGLNNAYIPASEAVLYHTTLLEPGTLQSIYFVAPEKPGFYQFVCTVPGHYVTMKGVMIVEPAPGS